MMSAKRLEICTSRPSSNTAASACEQAKGGRSAQALPGGAVLGVTAPPGKARVPAAAVPADGAAARR